MFGKQFIVTACLIMVQHSNAVSSTYDNYNEFNLGVLTPQFFNGEKIYAAKTNLSNLLLTFNDSEEFDTVVFSNTELYSHSSENFQLKLESPQNNGDFMVIELSIIIDGRIEQPQIDTVGSHVHLKLPDGFSTGKLINVGEVKIVSDIRESHELMYYLDYELQKYE